VFDCPLDVPRLATLIYLIAFAAITMGEVARALDTSKGLAVSG